MTAWADEHDVDLDASAAYSDSVFDAPLLGAVGRPTAVNPDYRLRALAVVRRWPVRSLDTPEGVPSVNGIEPFDLFRQFTRPEFFPGVRFAFAGIEHLPRTGAVIIATNHRSYFDPLVISLAIAKAGRNARFLGKKEVFDTPVVGHLARAMGGIRVDRGTGSDAPIRAAAERLEAGECVVILPRGRSLAARSSSIRSCEARPASPGLRHCFPMSRSSPAAFGAPSWCGPARRRSPISGRSPTRVTCP